MYQNKKAKFYLSQASRERRASERRSSESGESATSAASAPPPGRENTAPKKLSSLRRSSLGFLDEEAKKDDEENDDDWRYHTFMWGKCFGSNFVGQKFTVSKICFRLRLLQSENPGARKIRFLFKFLFEVSLKFGVNYARRYLFEFFTFLFAV